MSKKHIFYGIGCFALIVALIFGGLAGYRYLKDKGTSAPPPAPATQPAPEPDTSTTGIHATTNLGTPIVPESALGKTGIAASVLIGETSAGTSSISVFLLTFRRLENLYGANVTELLNTSTDRRARLRSHIAFLQNSYDEGIRVQIQLATEMAAIQTQYEALRKEQEAADTGFFTETAALNGPLAEELLQNFIRISRDMVDLRARFQALQKIKALYDRGLPRLAVRIQDISLNQEPLIAGTKVYDVQGSDLQLIVPVAAQQNVSEADRFQPISYPLLPIHPAQVNTGSDFITQPAGGFQDVQRKQ